MSRTTRSTEIEQQLAHLRWRRLQNERAIRNSLESSKAMQQNDMMLQISVNHTNEKKIWMTSVIEDELSRPLVLPNADARKLKSEEDGKELKNNSRISVIKSNDTKKSNSKKKIIK